MIINDDDAAARLKSPLNLINRLKSASPRKSSMSLFGIGRSKDVVVTKVDYDKKEVTVEEVKTTFNPFPSQKQESSELPAIIPAEQPTTLDNILQDNDSQIKLGLAHDNALKLLNDSVNLLSTKLDDVKADKLPAVIASASKVVESIRRERSESAKNGKDREVHYHFYTPQQKQLEEYKVIEVGGSA